nr:MAG: portal protein [Bacteriophage sp.]
MSNLAPDDIQVLPGVEVPRLTDWTQEPMLASLKQDLESCKSSHDTQKTKVAEWADYKNGTGKAAPKTQKGQSRVQPKLVRKQAEWRYAALSEPFLSTPDLFKVTPTTWEDKDGAIQNELVLNMQFTTKIDRVSLIDEYVRAAVDEGTVVLRTGWDYREETELVPEPIYRTLYDMSVVPVYQQMQQIEQQNPVQLLNYPQELQDGYNQFKQTGMPIRLIPEGVRMVEQVKVVKNQPTVEVCRLDNLYIDPSCDGDLNKANFIIYSFETSLAELKAEGRYKNLEKINVSNQSPLSAPDFQSGTAPDFQPAGKSRKRIVAYEYWGYWDIDGSGTLTPIVATWVGDICIRMEENPFPDRELPFVLVQYLPVRKSVYGEPDAELLKDNQDIVGAVTRGMIDLLGKSANSQTGFAKNMLDAANKKKFQQGEDYEYNPGINPQAGIFTHTFPEIPASAQFMVSMMNADAESLTGVKAFANSGITGSSLGDTATAVRGALDAASKREMGILRRLSTGLVKVARKIMAMNAVWLEEQEVVRITESQFVPVRRDDLKGEYDLKVTISTAEADEQQAQDLAFMLQTIGDIDFGFKQLILGEIARLRKMPDLRKQIMDFQPQPDPVQQQMAMLQMQLLQAQIQLTLSQAAENGTKADVNATKVGVEQARANQIQSTADKNNLDFLQTQNGVKHQQQLELLKTKGDEQLASMAMAQQGELDKMSLNHNLSLLQQHAKAGLDLRNQLRAKPNNAGNNQ